MLPITENFTDGFSFGETSNTPRDTPAYIEDVFGQVTDLNCPVFIDPLEIWPDLKNKDVELRVSHSNGKILVEVILQNGETRSAACTQSAE